jgi:hypothetical protein
MAIMDAKLEIDDNTDITAISGANQAGTDEIRLDAATALMSDAWGTAISPDPGEGNNGLVMNFQIADIFTSAHILTAKIFSHTTSTVTGGTQLGAVTFASGGTTAAGECSVTGTRKSFRLPAGNIDRYLGVQYSMISGASGGGSIDAWLSLDGETTSK